MIARRRGPRTLHRTLVTMALAVTTAALTIAVTGLIIAEAWRYRALAAADTQVLASVIAETSAAAVLFDDAAEAREILASVAVREGVVQACLYRDDGAVVASFDRRGGGACPAAPAAAVSWDGVAGVAAIRRNGESLGAVYVARALPELWPSVAVAAGTGLVMLVLASLVAIPLAHRLHRRISDPIVALAAAARTTGADGGPAPGPVIETEIPELRQLVGDLADMLARIGAASAELRRRESEREDLLGREREASRLKDEFLAAVSHELRTPLSTVVTWVQVLSMQPPDAATLSRGLAGIARSAHTQARVIEDLVDVSRIVAGKLTLHFDLLDLREPLEAAAEPFRTAADAKRVRLTLDLPRRRCPVRGDRDRLQQVFANLLSNAIKFTGSGGRVAVSLRCRDDSADVVVSDDGIGISAAFLPYVFDRFRQADGSMTREHGGLGLGLAIVKELCVLHGGAVRAESAGRNRGTTFVVTLPVAADARPVPAIDDDLPSGRRPLAGLRVLAVDDNVDALEALDLALSAAGADVRIARSGAAALTEARRSFPDVLLSDLSMPDMDGFAVLRAVRQVAPARPLPAIALSAHASEEHRARSRTAGFALHVAKPYRLEDLIDAVLSLASPRSRDDDRSLSHDPP